MTCGDPLPGTGRRAALVAGASFSHRAQGGGIWPDGAGMPDLQPQAPHQPTRHPSRPMAGNLFQAGRLRWLCRLPLVACWHATVSTVPRFQGQGRPPGQATRGTTMTQTSLAGAGPTPSPEGGQSQSGRHPCDQDPDANQTIRPAGLPSPRPTKGRCATIGQQP
jgi:hypothetical protein